MESSAMSDVVQPLSTLLTGTMPDPTDAKRRLMVAVKHSYPVFDSVMCETIVDTYMKYPDASPEEIIAMVPKDYFVTDKVSKQLSSPDEPRLEVVREDFSHAISSVSSSVAPSVADTVEYHHADTDGSRADTGAIVPPSTGDKATKSEEQSVPAKDPTPTGDSGSL
jgi:hypothetical protein